MVWTATEVQTLRERAPLLHYTYNICLLIRKVEVAVLEENTAVVLTRILASRGAGGIGKLVRGEELRSHRQAVSVRFS